MRSLLFVAGFALLGPYWLGEVDLFLSALPAVAMLLCYWRSLRWVLVFVLVFHFSSQRVQGQVEGQLDGCVGKLPFQGRLRIEAVHPMMGDMQRFVGVVLGPKLDLDVPIATLASTDCTLQAGHRLRLTWRSGSGSEPRLGPELVVGSTWLLDLVVSEPWSYQNPGGFDYERWLLASKLAATGYVRMGSLVDPAPPLEGLARLRQSLAAQLTGYSQAGVMQALALGDVDRLDSQDWERLRASGTVHLFVVSGLHVGLVASASFFVARWMLHLLPWLVALVPARRVAAAIALLISGIYVLLTGANVPGVRAWLMLCLALLWMARGRRLDMSLGIVWACIAVVVLVPESGWQQGFYLSFGAVAVLLFYFQPRYQTQSVGEEPMAGYSVSALAKHSLVLLQVQLALLFGLGPLTIALGLPTPSLGVLINLLAVPLVSLLAVPLALLGTLATLIWPSFGHLLLAGANHVLTLLQLLLDAAPLDALVPAPALPWWVHVLHGLVGLLCLLPIAWRLRLLLLLGYGAILLNWQPRLPMGEFALLVMDVGQGSAILVRTAQHQLLFDTGPAYNSGFSAAQAVIDPSLGALSIRRIDGLIVSHEDIDHAGGARQLRLRWQPKINLQGGRPLQPAVASTDPVRCRAGQSWIWDAVEFRILSPAGPTVGGRAARTSNDGSCVLQISKPATKASTAQQAVLFGDISTRVELQLLVALPRDVSIITAPHHGSSTSSSNAFVRRLNPRWVVASAARHSRYGHPHPTVVRRYCNVGAGLVVTGEVGAVRWSSLSPERIQLERNKAKPWRAAEQESSLNRCGEGV